MINEIERKFFSKNISNLNKYEYIEYERHFLFNNEIVEIRVQKKGNKYEFERKLKENSLKAIKQKFEITKEEYESLLKNSTKSIIRKSYIYSKKPEITIKKYEGEYSGLNRIEVEFNSIQEANDFKIPNWFGKEITNTKLGKDSKLIQLDKNEFNKLIEEYNK